MTGRIKILPDAEYDRLVAAVQMQRKALGLRCIDVAAALAVSPAHVYGALYSDCAQPGLLIRIADYFGIPHPPKQPDTCRRGHPFDGLTNRGARFCRTCKNAMERRRKAGR